MAKASLSRKLTLGNGNPYSIPREVKILSIETLTLPDGTDPTKQVHHRSQLLLEGGVQVTVKETEEEILNA